MRKALGILAGYALWLLPWTLFHEGGHFLAVLWYTGKPLQFHLQMVPLRALWIPRWIWYYPQGLMAEQRAVIGFAGFALEFLASGILILFFPLWGSLYLLGATAHFMLYPHYAGVASDFDYL